MMLGFTELYGFQIMLAQIRVCENFPSFDLPHITLLYPRGLLILSACCKKIPQEPKRMIASKID